MSTVLHRFYFLFLFLFYYLFFLFFKFLSFRIMKIHGESQVFKNFIALFPHIFLRKYSDYEAKIKKLTVEYRKVFNIFWEDKYLKLTDDSFLEDKRLEDERYAKLFED